MLLVIDIGHCHQTTIQILEIWFQQKKKYMPIFLRISWKQFSIHHYSIKQANPKFNYNGLYIEYKWCLRNWIPCHANYIFMSPISFHAQSSESGLFFFLILNEMILRIRMNITLSSCFFSVFTHDHETILYWRP